MKLSFSFLLLTCLLTFKAIAQPSLQFFTNQANSLLQSNLGISVNDIPIYSPTNPSVTYSASLHYLLQSAANAYDSTTPSTNLPSVFRPVFSWQSSNLFIGGYTTVTTDFLAQIGRGFKALADPTISSNDNVWGTPWVIGAKNNPPAFDGYSSSSEIILSRPLVFVRGTASNGSPATYEPPQYTNEFLMMEVSNLFSVGAWNYSSSAYTNGVTVMISNEVTISFTNNYDGGTNFVFDEATNYVIASWPGWTGRPSDSSFVTLLLSRVALLTNDYWSVYSAQFNSVQEISQEEAWYLDNLFSPDFEQVGWPVYNWTLNITNNFMYALVDNASGQVLDFVNLGNFGSSLNMVQCLTNASFREFPAPENLWAVGDATSKPNSPMSQGALNQINEGAEQNEDFRDGLLGIPTPGENGFFFEDPDIPTAILVQTNAWQPANPLVHYTLADLSAPTNVLECSSNELSVILFNGSESVPPFPPLTSSLAQPSPYYNSGAIKTPFICLTNGAINLTFSGVTDLPYQVGAATNLLDWGQIGTASQPSPGIFRFSDPSLTNFPARFYKTRLP